MTIVAHFDLPALLRAAEQAEADIKANAPLPPVVPLTEADALAAFKAAQPKIDALDAWVKAYPGALRALGRILAELGAQGFTWASELDTALSAGPGALAAEESWAPTIIGLLTTFAPAPIPIDGARFGDGDDRMGRG